MPQLKLNDISMEDIYSYSQRKCSHWKWCFQTQACSIWW